MPLTSCAACTNEISKEASVCPKCGHPNKPHNSSGPTAKPNKVFTIEQTSKKHKSSQAVGVIFFILCLILLFSGLIKISIAMLVLGVVFYYGGKAAAWWDNG